MDKIVQSFPDLRLNTLVVSVERSGPGEKVIVVDVNGNREEYDHVIFATHTDQALKILGDGATAEERKVLGSIKYLKNRLVLHRDFNVSATVYELIGWSEIIGVFASLVNAADKKGVGGLELSDSNLG